MCIFSKLDTCSLDNYRKMVECDGLDMNCPFFCDESECE